MSTNARRSTFWSKQIGEALVCAELGRRGLVASAFAGNVKDFDVIAANSELRSIPIQVKAFVYAPDTHPCWPLTGQFLDIIVDKRSGKQTLRGKHIGARAELIYAFVLLRDEKDQASRDRFFLCVGSDVRRLCVTHYRAFLRRHNGRRPRSPESQEMRLRPIDLRDYENNWELVIDRLSAITYRH